MVNNKMLMTKLGFGQNPKPKLAADPGFDDTSPITQQSAYGVRMQSIQGTPQAS